MAPTAPAAEHTHPAAKRAVIHRQALFTTILSQSSQIKEVLVLVGINGFSALNLR